MLIIVTATIIALLMAYVLMKIQKIDPAQLMEPRTSLLTMSVQIICGDCSGDAEHPHKTFLDRFGNCEQCGGQSYILASNRAAYACQLMAGRRAEYEITLNKGRVLPFESPTASRAARAQKMAV